MEQFKILAQIGEREEEGKVLYIYNTRINTNPQEKKWALMWSNPEDKKILEKINEYHKSIPEFAGLVPRYSGMLNGFNGKPALESVVTVKTIEVETLHEETGIIYPVETIEVSIVSRTGRFHESFDRRFFKPDNFEIVTPKASKRLKRLDVGNGTLQKNTAFAAAFTKAAEDGVLSDMMSDVVHDVVRSFG